MIISIYAEFVALVTVFYALSIMLMLKSLWSGMTMRVSVVSQGGERGRNSCFAQLNPKAKVRGEDEEKKFVELVA